MSRKMGADDWPPVLRHFESGPFTMKALSYEHQLLEEGNAMQPCVGGYAERCRFEPLRIFSVRNKRFEQRVSTLSLEEQTPGSWNSDQLKGLRNAEVDPLLWYEVDGLRRVMNQVSRSDFKSRQFLDFIHSLG